MRSFFILLFFSFSILCVKAQDITQLLKEAYQFEAQPNEKMALAKYKEVLKLQPIHLFALCRSSELCSRIGKRETNPQLRSDYFEAAKTYAGIALKVKPDDSEANCVMAIALGRNSMTKSGKDKINNAKDIKGYLDKSLKGDPQNFKAWHVLGRWHFEISNLNVFERAAVNLLYGGMPDASLAESIRCFEKTRSLAPGFILNYYEMARAYYDHRETAKAKDCINTMLNLPNQTEDDPVIKENGRRLLKVWP
ncbi:MAG: hypothetical protein IPP31_11680 [Chitinophagaceae bacterium]|nr:hypothetical protein [Chitinophagaceae bacterium]